MYLCCSSQCDNDFEHMEVLRCCLAVYFCRIVRDQGIYGSAVVTYQILESMNVTSITVGSLFVSTTGLVTFADRQFNAELTIMPLNTGLPHFDLHYIVQLINVTGKLAATK